MGASPNCLPTSFTVTEIPERSGIFSSLKSNCKTCKFTGYVDNTERGPSSFREGYKLNESLCLAAHSVELDFNGLQRLTHILGLDGPPDSWDTVYSTRIHEVLKITTENMLAENRARAHSHRGSDGSKPIKISIKSDGTYQKRGDRSRGNTSKLGIVVIFDGDLDIPLDYIVISKFCQECVSWNSRDGKGEITDSVLEAWKRNHQCSKTFEGMVLYL